RESTRALRRARAVLALGDERPLPPLPHAPPGIERFRGRVLPTHAVSVRDGALVPRDLPTLPRRGVVAVAGVARPERFWALLDRLGVECTARLRFPDHHPYGAEEVARIRAAAGPVVTTEKDLVKLVRRPGAEALDLHAVRIEVAVEGGERLVDLLLAP